MVEGEKQVLYIIFLVLFFCIHGFLIYIALRVGTLIFCCVCIFFYPSAIQILHQHKRFVLHFVFSFWSCSLRSVSGNYIWNIIPHCCFLYWYLIIKGYFSVDKNLVHGHNCIQMSFAHIIMFIFIPIPNFITSVLSAKHFTIF